jgi:hypothetical protein
MSTDIKKYVNFTFEIGELLQQIFEKKSYDEKRSNIKIDLYSQEISTIKCSINYCTVLIGIL